MTVHGPLGCHFRVVYRSWAGAGISREQHWQLSRISSSAQTLPRPLQSKSTPRTALVSGLEGVAIPVSPQLVQQSPRGATTAHKFLYVLHVALGTAWCPPGADTGLGLLQHLPLSHKAQSTASPQLPGGKGGWYPMTSPHQHPPASSELSAGGGERMRCRTSRALALRWS